MAERRDALAAAAEIALALEALWQDDRGVATAGRVACEPNATNVVPGFVELWTEMRSVDGPLLVERRQAFLQRAQAIAHRRRVRIHVDDLSTEEPIPIPADVQDECAGVLRTLGHPDRRLPSYAGHDGNQLAKIAPIGMLFVPSRDGRSHCPEEWTDPPDVLLGVTALAAALLRFDALPIPSPPGTGPG
jgi:N-carbamoyl-L-amino-acid hydrolase